MAKQNKRTWRHQRRLYLKTHWIPHLRKYPQFSSLPNVGRHLVPMTNWGRKYYRGKR